MIFHIKGLMCSYWFAELKTSFFCPTFFQNISAKSMLMNTWNNRVAVGKRRVKLKKITKIAVNVHAKGGMKQNMERSGKLQTQL